MSPLLCWQGQLLSGLIYISRTASAVPFFMPETDFSTFNRKIFENLLTCIYKAGIMCIKDIYNIHEVHYGYYYFKFFRFPDL